jgi:bacillithiol biosynthesis cysteine-adding enzyme BshC
VLIDVLNGQYATLNKHDRVQQNILLLQNENAYTICTAHQPNLMTGYLYFIYKIIHAIKLAEELSKDHPDKHFVPVYYMGSEDNDLDELGTFRYEEKKFSWDAGGQSGAVGRMRTESLEPLLQELFRLMGPPGENYTELRDIITKAYLRHNTIAAATQYLVNELFGRYGLLVIDPDNAALKRAFIPVMRDDLLSHVAYDIVSAESAKPEQQYKAQAYPRQINLFYLRDDIRERIERQGDSWKVLNTDICWSEQELLAELETSPERFSPNVILRGVFQETILPNVVFIGGGAEVAYWLQLKKVFEHYGVFYPNIQLRQSILWINARDAKARKQLELSITDIFKPEVDLLKNYISLHSSDDWHTSEEENAMEAIMQQLKQKAARVDATLRASAEASLAKIRYQLQVLEKKMLRAEKKKMHVQLSKISRLKESLFPSGNLQERVENFITYYLQYGTEYFDILMNAMHPYEAALMVIENKD